MLKKSCLAAAAIAAALTTTAATAAIVSLDFAATLPGALNVNATLTWDPSAPTTPINGGVEALANSLTLTINGQDFSSTMSNLRLQAWRTTYASPQDSFYLEATTSGISLLPAGITMLQLFLFDNDGQMYGTAPALPTDLSAFNGVEQSSMTFRGTSVPPVFAHGTISATPTTTPPTTTPTTNAVPEPGSLLLVALAGLALGAARRRSTAA